jgi:hypothetical protein
VTSSFRSYRDAIKLQLGAVGLLSRELISSSGGEDGRMLDGEREQVEKERK